MDKCQMDLDESGGADSLGAALDPASQQRPIKSSMYESVEHQDVKDSGHARLAKNPKDQDDKPVPPRRGRQNKGGGPQNQEPRQCRPIERSQRQIPQIEEEKVASPDVKARIVK